MTGPPYGDSADERSRERREKAAEAHRKFRRDYGQDSYPDDPGRKAHQERQRAKGKKPSKGCLFAAAKISAGTITALAIGLYMKDRRPAR